MTPGLPSWLASFANPCLGCDKNCPFESKREVVATLALGLRPRQGFVRLRAKREARNHTTYSREYECLSPREFHFGSWSPGGLPNL